MSKPLKFAIVLAIALGLFAAYAAERATQNAASGKAHHPAAIVNVPIIDEPTSEAPQVRSTNARKSSSLTREQRNARAKQAASVEDQLPNWGERGMPVTDSVSTRIVRTSPK